MVRIPDVVRRKALAAGAVPWLEGLSDLVAALERDWSITVGSSYSGGTESFVAQAVLSDGTPAVLKLLAPGGGHAADEITAAAC